MVYAIVGDYPLEFQDESFRADIKVLEFDLATIKLAKSRMVELEDEGYENLDVWETKSVL